METLQYGGRGNAAQEQFFNEALYIFNQGDGNFCRHIQTLNVSGNKQTTSMTKLKRYTNFERLKQVVNSSNTTSDNNNEQPSELEEFVNLLRSELLIKKKTGNPKIAD